MVRDFNPFLIKNWDYLEYVHNTISIEFDKIFKNYNYKNAINKYILNKLFAISYNDDNNLEFKNAGFFGEAISLGARFDLNKILNLIKEMKPEQNRIDDEFNSLVSFVESSNFYKEMMKTNRYLALSCTINEFFNKSILKNEQYYINPNSEFIKGLSKCIAKRNNFSKQQYEGFMKLLTPLYYSLRTNSDEFKFIDKQDIANLNMIINTIDNIPYFPTSY